MKWLNPKKHKLPFNEVFIAVIIAEDEDKDCVFAAFRRQQTLIVKILKHNIDFDYFNDLEEWYEDYGLMSADEYRLKKYYEKDIIAWMRLPDPIEEKFCQKTFEYYLDFEEEV